VQSDYMKGSPIGLNRLLLVKSAISVGPLTNLIQGIFRTSFIKSSKMKNQCSPLETTIISEKKQ